MGWGPSAPAPDPAVGQAAAAAEQRAADNDTYFRQNFAPKYLEQMDQQIAIGKQQADQQQQLQDYTMGLSKKYDQRYWDTTAKQEDQFYNQVDQFNTPGNQEAAADRATTDVESNTNAGFQALQRGLQRTGSNPNSSQYMSMLNDNQLAGSLGKASAATMAREAARREGIQLRAQAAGLGGGMATSAATNLANASGNAGMNAVSASGAGMNAVTGAANGFNANNNAWLNNMNFGLNSRKALMDYNADIYKNSSSNGAMGALTGVAGSAAMGWLGSLFSGGGAEAGILAAAAL